MDKTGANDGLKYIGDGTAIVGVPARDLTAAEADQHGRAMLLMSGLYVMAKKAYTPKPTKSAVKGDKDADTQEDRS
jgi:hypothetical protein